MATTILLKADEITRNTVLGGNIDVDKLTPAIKTYQNTKLRELIGNELYNKLQLDFENNSLSGIYLELYESYIKELIIYGSSEIYLTLGAYTINNNGIVKLSTDNTQTVSKEEVDYMVSFCRKIYEHYRILTVKFLKTSNIPEFSNSCKNNRIQVGGWLLKKR